MSLLKEFISCTFLRLTQSVSWSLLLRRRFSWGIIIVCHHRVFVAKTRVSL